MAASPSPSPDEDDRVSIGSVLDGRYRIDAVLGSGGMGRVYRGEHTGIGRAVAIKVLHADLNRNREAAARFQREAIASGRLDHPNIVGVTDFGVLSDGSCYLVMEVLEGESLGDRLERERRIPWGEAIDILRGVLLGLHHAHERGVVHRDIKPDNVFLARKDGELIVKILDFGIAKLYAGSADDPASTRAGLTVGTPAYLSPEQAVGGDITPASDLYSATIVLFEMIAGRTPFEDRDPLAMLGAHVSRTPPRLHEVAPELALPVGLEDVIQAGLIKASSERIRSATDYLGFLDGVQATAQTLGSAPVPIPDFVPPPSPEQLGAMPTTSLPVVPGTGPVAGSPGTGPVVVTGSPGTGPVVVPHSRITPPPALHDQSMMITVEPYTPLSGPTVTPPPVTTGSFASAALGHAPTASLTPLPGDLPPQAHPVSLADISDPIPRRWIIVGGIVLAVIVVVAIVLAITDDGGGAKPARPRTPPGLQANPGEAPERADRNDRSDRSDRSDRADSPPPAEDDELPPSKSTERDIQLKALLHDLQNGKTCEDRRQVIASLVALEDPRAVPALKRARYRGVGGVLGIAEKNANHCLVKDVDAALKQLAPAPPPQPKRGR